MLYRVVLILDGAPETWKQVVSALVELRAQLLAQNLELYLLGSSTQYSETSLSLEVSPVGQQLALIAPALRAALTREPLISAAVVVTARPVFDLEDWSNYPGLDRIILLRTGSTPLQERATVMEFQLGQHTELDALLQVDSNQRYADKEMWTWQSSNMLRYSIDRCGYPLVYVEPIGIWVHLFPITWLQLELFLADAGPPGLDDAWYGERQRGHWRASVYHLVNGDYEHLLATGLARSEVLTLARWFDPSYRLLTGMEWQMCARFLKDHSATTFPVELDDRLSNTARVMWERLLVILAPTTQAHLALMEAGCGVLEWVAEPLPQPPWVHGGFVGQPRPRFYKNLLISGRVYEALQERNRFQGVRLCTTNRQ